jgi:hypothetical protein
MVHCNLEKSVISFGSAPSLKGAQKKTGVIFGDTLKIINFIIKITFRKLIKLTHENQI